jgi:archaeosine synthase
MKFQCHDTDGPAQTGILSIHNKKIKTPSILFPASNRYHPPSFTEGFISYSNEKQKKEFNPLITVGNSIFFKHDSSSEKNILHNYIIIPETLPSSVHQFLHQYDEQSQPDIQVLPSDDSLLKSHITTNSAQLLIVSNAAHLFNHPKKFVSYVISTRKLSNYDSMIYFPSIGTPSTLALLSYSGGDLFDATSAILASRHLYFFLPDTSCLHVKEIRENACVCPVCLQTQSQPSSYSFTQLLQHNYFMIWQELLTIRQAIQHNHLRDLFEKRIRNAPHLITILRYLDSLGEDYLEQRTPVSMSNSYVLQVTSREAGFRPDIKRFQHRVLTRYQKPKGKKILVLLPCSAKKPYSLSQSHQRFYQAISKASNHSVIHELIITSPLGLVPREIELVYPASSYDISVTGEWYEDEKQMIQQQLNNFLNQHQYDHVVSHLPETLIQPFEQRNLSCQYSCTTEKPTSKQSLRKLSEILIELTTKNAYDPIAKSELKKSQLTAIAAFQFGPTLAQALTEDTVIKGKYPYLKLFDYHNNQLGMIPDKRGLISLTAEGGKRICHLKKYTVTIDTGFTVKGSILAPGVISANDEIRKGDDVIVFQEERYLGVGNARMSGVEMTQRSYGEAVNMRHKISP